MAEQTRQDEPVRLGALAVPLAVLALAVAALYLTLWLAVHAALPSAVTSLLVPAAFIGAVIALLKVAARWSSAPRPLLRRPALWLLVLLATLTLPQLGSFGLIDPWESHYAEVAREMLSRADPISMWWGHDGWFMSKPVLTFWLEAASMGMLGARFAPGDVLAGGGAFAQPEWPVRWPGALAAVLGCMVLYRGVAAHAGRAVGCLATLVLATAAQWTLASRHALTDAPFNGALIASFGFVLLAWSTPEDAVVTPPRLQIGQRSLALHPRWLLLACIGCAVGAQIAWLLHIGIDLELSALPPRIRMTADALTAGSPGNCGLPSQPVCTTLPPAHPWLTPALQALLWTLLLVPLLWSVAREQRARRLLLLAAWLCMGLATMAKGLAGFVVPLAVAGTTLILQRRWRELWRSELIRGTALLVLLVLPWFLAAFARHGRIIIDELVSRHMLGRALDHLHDTNAGADVGVRYYLGQLGYALFPWTGFVPAALASACARRSLRPLALQRTLDFALVWLVLTFGLFTFMRTKFHHYILPAVPALAVLVGLYLAEAAELLRANRQPSAAARLLILAGAFLTLRVGADLVLPLSDELPGSARLYHLLSYRYDRAWPDELDYQRPLLVFTGVIALIQLVLGISGWARGAIAAQAAAALIFSAWLGQHYLVQLGAPFGQRRVIEAFQRSRTSASEPLVAYQLNWKGENFYTGNRLAIFVSSGEAFRRYVDERRRESPWLHVALETQRLRSLRAELGTVKALDVLTTPAESDKISLVRVQLY